MKKIFAGMTMTALLVSAFGASVFADGLKTVSVNKLQTVGRMEEQRGSMITIKESEKEAWPETVTFELKTTSNVKWNARTIINGKDKPQIDSSVLKFTVKTNPKYQDVAYIVPYFDIDRGADVGDLTVLVSSNAKGDKEETLTIAKISDYGVTMSSSYEKIAKNSKSVPVEIMVGEAIQNSLIPNIPYALVFDNATVDANSVKVTQTKGIDKLAVGDVKNDYAEFKLTENSSDINKFTITLNITPTKDYTGDITAKFEGTGVETMETVVATVNETLAVSERTPDNIVLGMQDQKLSDIVISENMASALSAGEYMLKLSPEYKGLSFTSAQLNSDSEGDIRVSSASAKNNEIKFTVKGESTIPSKLTFSDLKVTIDRFGYVGKYQLQLVNAKNPDVAIETIDLFNASVESTTPVVPTTPETKQDGIAFVIESKDYTITADGKTEQKSLDVAPYIAKGNRTMLPVRAVAETLDMDVEWNAEARTATLKSKDGLKTIVLTLGNKIMLVDGKEVTLDSVPEIKDGRTFLPVAQIAEALNVKTNWEASTKTVTIVK